MFKIKLIDDDVELTSDLKEILVSEGFQVEIYNLYDNALGFIHESVPHLLILDVMFPDNPSGGFDIARKIRTFEDLKTMPIILFTSINQELPMDFSEKDIDDDWIPVQAFMEKPIDPVALLSKVKELLNL